MRESGENRFRQTLDKVDTVSIIRSTKQISRLRQNSLTRKARNSFMVSRKVTVLVVLGRRQKTLPCGRCLPRSCKRVFVFRRHKMSSQYRVLCGTPEDHCFGTKLITDQQLHTAKCHMNHSDAFRCYAHYLVHVLGFTRLSSREFQNPDGGPIRILTRQSKFGSKLKTGKLQERFMPEDRQVGNRGVIIG